MKPVNPKKVVELWVDAFNRGDADAIAGFYAENAINHQVAETPVEGKLAIREMAKACPFLDTGGTLEVAEMMQLP